MNKKDLIYVTTTLPYVNADPHIGFAFELVSADIFVRHKQLAGHEVFFNTGTDEHGLKIYRKALEEGKEPQAYVDELAERFKKLLGALNISPDINFIRTTDSHHKAAAAEFWRRCKARGFIYIKNYRVKYCVGCELEKTDSELKSARCAIHPNLELEIIDEENYFFKFSAFGEFLQKLYSDRSGFVIPEVRFNEIKAFVSRGLEDFSISRLTEKMPWGIPVPDDPAHTMYAWFDALVDYVSAIGWPNDTEAFDKWWVGSGGVIQFAGKDQVRQQAAMWQAMLNAAGLPPSQKIVIHGFLTSGGQKMSKSLGNVIDPFALVSEYGTDAVRWYLARHVHPFEDSDFTLEKFKEAYNADLANGIGNLTSRVMKMAQEHLSLSPRSDLKLGERSDLDASFDTAFGSYNIQRAAEIVGESVATLDRRIQETEPFKLIKKHKEKGKAVIQELVFSLYTIAQMLLPILPATSQKIQSLIKANQMPTEPLFPRKA